MAPTLDQRFTSLYGQLHAIQQVQVRKLNQEDMHVALAFLNRMCNRLSKRIDELSAVADKIDIQLSAITARMP